MTREEIMGMVPGRELDAKTHYHVLKRTDALIFAPNYSTDISAAWEAVEKLNKKYDYVLFSGSDGKLYSQFVCCYDGDEETFEEYFAEAKTAPEAICKAALLAVMEGGN